jgi:hypothetical protein
MKMGLLALALLGSCRCDRQSVVVVRQSEVNEAGPEVLELPAQATPPLPVLGSVQSDPSSVVRQVEDLKRMGLGYLVDAGSPVDAP